MATRYDDYLTGKHQITMGGVTNDLWADPKDYAEFVKIVTKMKDDSDLTPMVQFAMKLIKKGTDPEEVNQPKFDEKVERYLWKNVASLADEMTIAFGLTTRERLDELKKIAEDKLKKKDKN